MIHQTNNYSMSAKQSTNVPNIYHGIRSANSFPSPDRKPTLVWESPEFEEFDLCMEVTAYVHQWK